MPILQPVWIVTMTNWLHHVRVENFIGSRFLQEILLCIAYFLHTGRVYLRHIKISLEQYNLWNEIIFISYALQETAS